MGRIILSADDFGLTLGVNRGIIKAFNHGLIRSASLMANAVAFQDAVNCLKANPGLDVGIHLTLVEERPLLSVSDIPSLVDKDGYLFKDCFKFLSRFFIGRVKLEHIEIELDAQFQRLIKKGIKISHIDSHQHIHMIPAILNVVIRLAKKYGINKIRCPLRFNPLFSIRSFGHFWGNPGLNILGFFYYPYLIKSNFLSPKYSFNLSAYKGGLGFKETLKRLVTVNSIYLTEISCHPGELDDMLATRYRHWDFHWEEELDALTCGQIKQLAASSPNSLIGFDKA
jgi:predicted glycoside hydrolase/deacetylase ChbG (UPF0249 family)